MAKQKRIFEIAKDLGIESKAIIAKCIAEGIPEATVKNHMAAISAGLEATIREWFTAHEPNAGAAVENAEKVDIESVKVKRARPSRARSKTAGEPGSGDSESDASESVAIAEPPAAPAVVQVEAAVPTAPEAPRRAAAIVAPAAPSVPEVPPAPVVIAPVTVPVAAPAPVVSAPVAAPAAAERAAAPEEPAEDEAEDVPAAVASAPVASPVRATSEAVKPAPMNVPTRPTVVKPMGQKLQVQAPVKLSGPKIVRVEAPEVVQAPRPRRAPGDGPIPASRGPRPGGGAGAGPARGPGGPTEEDKRRANKRRVGAVPARRQGHSDADLFQGPAVFSEQDLIEREARLIRAGGFLKKKRQELKTKGAQAPGERSASPAQVGGRVRIAAPFTIKDLSAATGVKAADIIKKLFLQGVMSTINSGIDADKAQEIMFEYNIELEIVEAKSAEEAITEQFEKDRPTGDVRPRGPVVTILGHVDHGKTSLLDKIRNANVAAGEAGGITQKTSAFRTPVEVAGDTKYITFLDTPGHEAFTAMRSRGAQMTDVVVLVVSAPEGVMPQTIESINHAKAAEVPIVVALNKIDRPDATPAAIQKALSILADNGLNPTEWGGDTEVIKTSATQGIGITDLLEALDYQAQLLELTADFSGAAQGTVIESRVDEGRGVTATVLVQQGCLKVGDFVVAGRAFGRVREIVSDRGEKLREAVPPMPVQITGLDELPDAGDKLFITDTLKQASEAADQRRMRERQAELAKPKAATLDSLFTQMADATVKEILIVLKADLQGTLDVLKNEIEKVSTAEVKVRVLHSAVGGINESDVLLADASKAVIVGFNVISTGKARQMAESRGIEIRTYQVIYHIVEDMKKAAEGMLEPELRQEILGHAEVRAVFKVSKVGAVAGCYITDGIVQRDAKVRVTRNGIVVENDRVLEQLKRFKDDAKEVRAGMECGMKIVGYDDIKEGDVIECYKQVEVKRKL